jgi:hypothetical protein
MGQAHFATVVPAQPMESLSAPGETEEVFSPSALATGRTNPADRWRWSGQRASQRGDGPVWRLKRGEGSLEWAVLRWRKLSGRERRRWSRGHQLGGHGAAVSSGGGRGGEGSLGGWSERSVHATALGGQGIKRWPSLRRLLELWLEDSLLEDEGGARATRRLVAWGKK